MRGANYTLKKDHKNVRFIVKDTNKNRIQIIVEKNIDLGHELIGSVCEDVDYFSGRTRYIAVFKRREE